MNIFCLSVFVALAWAYSAVISFLLAPLNYHVLDIRYICLIMILSGTFGALIGSLIMEK